MMQQQTEAGAGLRSDNVVDEQPTVLYEFEKTRATVRAYITHYRGKRYAHIREFVEPRDHPGAQLIATKAGICVEVDDLDELEACVKALATAIGDRSHARAAS